MKVIKLSQILTFLLLASLIIFTAFTSVFILTSWLNWDVSFNFLNFLLFFVFFWIYLFIVFNLLLRVLPIPLGAVPENSRAEWIYHLYALFNVIFFHPITLSNISPVPMRRKYYQLLGAKMGFNTYPSGIILDPQFVEFGESCIIGFNALLCPHILVNGELSHYPIKIGNFVTIAVGATIYGGCTIEDDARILPHSVVNPNTHIKKGEVWGGTPAKKINI